MLLMFQYIGIKLWLLDHLSWPHSGYWPQGDFGPQQQVGNSGKHRLIMLDQDTSLSLRGWTWTQYKIVQVRNYNFCYLRCLKVLSCFIITLAIAAIIVITLLLFYSTMQYHMQFWFYFYTILFYFMNDHLCLSSCLFAYLKMYQHLHFESLEPDSTLLGLEGWHGSGSLLPEGQVWKLLLSAISSSVEEKYSWCNKKSKKMYTYITM